MTKKFVSMLLALAMCLALSAPAWAAEEAAETVSEPAVQTEVETPTTDEAAAQAADCLHQNYTAVRRKELDPNDHNASGHAVHDMEYHTCTICNRVIYQKNHSTTYAAHIMYKTGYSVIIDLGNGDVTLPLYACRLCNYSEPRTA